MKRIDQRLAPGYTFSIGETVRLDFRFSEIEAEIVESSMSEPDRFAHAVIDQVATDRPSPQPIGEYAGKRLYGASRKLLR